MKTLKPSVTKNTIKPSFVHELNTNDKIEFYDSEAELIDDVEEVNFKFLNLFFKA